MGDRDRRDEQRSRGELLAELARLRSGSREAELQRLVHELEVHQEELQLQQLQLIESRRALEDVRDRYAQLFDFAPVAYVVLDAHGVIREANLSAARLLEIERGRLLGRSLTRYVVPADRDAMLRHLSDCRSGRAHVETELVVRRTGGDTAPVQLTSAPAVAGQPDMDMFRTAIIDLSERKRSEAEQARTLDEQRRLLQEEHVSRAASEAKDRFLAMLSHELRTPLAPILFAIDSVQARTPIPDTLRPTLAMIRRNVLLETRLIDDLLDMTRIVQGKMSIVTEVVDVHDVVHDVVMLCDDQLQRAPVTFTVETAATSHNVRADPVRLRQVVWNLLNNAVRNTPAGGRITLRTDNGAPGWLTLTVSDSGRGIDAGMLSRIFTFFEQDEEMRRTGVGLGLGLPISKAIVESHGGRITAASAGLGMGATFAVDLRTVSAEPAPSSVAISPAAPSCAATVLLVEDNNDSATAMAEFLRLHGYAVKVAGSVREALDLIGDDDLLVSDIALPDGTGHELMRLVSARRHVRGIALSGYGTPEDLTRSADAGFARHIVKPVEPSELLSAIADLALRRK